MGGPDPVRWAGQPWITARGDARQPVLLHADQLEEILDPSACPQDRKEEFLEVLLSSAGGSRCGLHLR